MLRYRYLDVKASYYDTKFDLAEAKGDEVGGEILTIIVTDKNKLPFEKKLAKVI